MPRPKRKSFSTASEPDLLLRSRASRDITLRKIRNLDVLAREARTEVEKQPLFLAHFVSLDKYISQFEEQQQEVLNVMLDSGLQDDFNNLDLLSTDEVKEILEAVFG